MLHYLILHYFNDPQIDVALVVVTLVAVTLFNAALSLYCTF